MDNQSCNCKPIIIENEKKDSTLFTENMMPGNSNLISSSNVSVLNVTTSQDTESSRISLPQNEAPISNQSWASYASADELNSNQSFSSLNCFPIVQKPPAQGATFMQHPQIFEYIAIYRHMVTRGTFRSKNSKTPPTRRMNK